MLFYSTTDLGHASYDLPDDVFAEGEVKPTRPKKKASKKRDIDTMEVRLLSISILDVRSRRSAEVAKRLNC